METSTLPHEVKDRLPRARRAAGGDTARLPAQRHGGTGQVRDVVVYGSGDEAAFERVRGVLEIFSGPCGTSARSAAARR